MNKQEILERLERLHRESILTDQELAQLKGKFLPGEKSNHFRPKQIVVSIILLGIFPLFMGYAHPNQNYGPTTTKSETTVPKQKKTKAAAKRKKVVQSPIVSSQPAKVVLSAKLESIEEPAQNVPSLLFRGRRVADSTESLRNDSSELLAWSHPVVDTNSETETPPQSVEPPPPVQNNVPKTASAKLTSLLKRKEELPLAPQPKIDRDTQYQNARSAANAGNFSKAHEIWTRLSEQGDVSSTYNLGRLYARGGGVSRNFTTARSYFEKAAANGHGRATFSLGVMYERGDGVRRSINKALSYYRTAKKLGVSEAGTKLAKLSESRNDEKRDRRLNNAMMMMESFANTVRGTK